MTTGFLGSVSESGGISLPASQAALFLPPNVHDIRPAFSKFFDNSQRLGPMIPLTGGELPLSAALATPAQQPLFPVVNFPSQLNAGALTGALNADEMTVIDVMDAADFIAIPADKSGESELTLQSPNFWTGSQSGSSTSWTGESPAIETEQAFPTASGADQQIVVKVKEEPRDEDQDAEMAPLDSEDSDYRPTKRPRNSSGEVHSKAAKPKKPRNRSKESAASEDLGSTTASLASSSQTAATKRRKPARNPSEVVSARTLANTARTLFSTAVGNLTADEKEKCYNAIFAKRAKNTEAARRSRERKREYVEELENRVKELEEEVQRYKIERREMEEMISQLQVASS